MRRAERLARRMHRWQLDEAGEPLLGHLERVAGLVASYGGGPAAVDVAWLHEAHRAGFPEGWLRARGVPPRVAAALEAARRRPSEPAAEWVARVRGTPAAVLVVRAHLVDLVRPERVARLDDHARQWRTADTVMVLRGLDAPLPAGLEVPAGGEPARPAPTRPAQAARGLHGSDPGLLGGAVTDLRPDEVRENLDVLLDIAGRGREWRYARREAHRQIAALDDVAAWRALLRVAVDPRSISWFPEARTLAASRASGVRSLVPELRELLRAPGVGASDAAFVLGEWRVPGAVPDLVAALEAGSPELTRFAVEALGKIGAPEAGPALARLLDDPAPGLRASALWALSQSGGPGLTEAALAAVDDVDPDVRERAVRVLAAAGDERAVPRLLTLCDGPLAGVVLPGLERLADPRAVPTLARLVRTADDNRTRRLAGRALAASAAAGGTRAGLDLYLYASDDRDTLRIAAWVLGQVGDRSAVAPLSRAVTYPDPVVRARAAESLGRLGDAAAVEPLRGALSDVAPSVRANAATALGRLGSPEAAEPLRAALSDEDPNVRSAAAAALRRLG